MNVILSRRFADPPPCIEVSVCAIGDFSPSAALGRRKRRRRRRNAVTVTDQQLRRRNLIDGPPVAREGISAVDRTLGNLSTASSSAFIAAVFRNYALRYRGTCLSCETLTGRTVDPQYNIDIFIPHFRRGRHRGAISRNAYVRVSGEILVHTMMTANFLVAVQ
jgi:hypothetical protein